MHIIYRSGPDWNVAHWQSLSNHTENKGQEIAGMGIIIGTISTSVNMPVCASIEDIQAAAWGDVHLQELKAYIIHNNSFSIAETDTTTAAQQPHGNRKDEVPSVWISILGGYECRYQKHLETVCYMLNYYQTQPNEQTIPHDLLCKSW